MVMPRTHEILGYDVLETLGQGAKSTIYAVRDKSDQIYALKHVIRESAADDRFLDQAIAEHEVAKDFDHPGLRRSYKLVRQRALIRVSEIYVLMELVDGRTMEQHKCKDLSELCEIAGQTADALEAMHQSGYVHCDIKPNNIMVTDEGQVKVIDFGQSCAIGTVKERIQGTPDYIAPEQVKRKRLTPQTDVFNLGATLYFLATGQHIPTMIPKKDHQRPEAGELASPEEEEPARKEIVPPREINANIPPALSSLIMQCVTRDPSDRPETMGDVKNRLGLALNQMGRSQEEAAGQSRRSSGKKTGRSSGSGSSLSSRKSSSSGKGSRQSARIESSGK